MMCEFRRGQCISAWMCTTKPRARATALSDLCRRAIQEPRNSFQCLGSRASGRKLWRIIWERQPKLPSRNTKKWVSFSFSFPIFVCIHVWSRRCFDIVSLCWDATEHDKCLVLRIAVWVLAVIKGTRYQKAQNLSRVSRWKFLFLQVRKVLLKLDRTLLVSKQPKETKPRTDR